MNKERVTIVGAGLAGCEAAWQLVRRGVPVRLIDAHLNDAAFAAQCTERLLALMKTKGPKGEVL